MFEGWSDEKLERYNIDPDTYDHTNIASRPAVLMEGYCPQKIPFLTVIFLWDKNVDFLLSSRHDPLKIGEGEPGMGLTNNRTSDTVSMITSDASSCSPKKGKGRLKKMEATTEGLEDMMKNIISLCKSGGDNKATKVKGNDKETLLLDNRPLNELFGLIDQHNKHLKLLKEMGMLSEEKKVAIVGEIEAIFAIVNKRTSNKKRSSVDISSDTSNVSN